jgi:hypothetical protein
MALVVRVVADSMNWALRVRAAERERGGARRTATRNDDRGRSQAERTSRRRKLEIAGLTRRGRKNGLAPLVQRKVARADAPV